MGPVFILGGCLSTMVDVDLPETGHSDRDYGLERMRGIMFASLGMVLSLLSVLRLFPDLL